MSTLEQIRDLDIENVQPEHFIELGSEVVQALRDILGDDAVRKIYDVAKGEDKEGFGERFPDALERYNSFIPLMWNLRLQRLCLRQTLEIPWMNFGRNIRICGTRT